MVDSQNGASEILRNVLTSLSERLQSEEAQKRFADGVATVFMDSPSEKYGDDFFFGIIKPILSSLIRIKDDSAKELRYFNDFVHEKNCKNEATAYAVEILEGFLESLNDLLLDYNVQPFKCEDTKFNPRRQSVVKKLIAGSPEQVKTVAESLSDGYERNGIVISKERVVAYATDSNS